MKTIEIEINYLNKVFRIRIGDIVKNGKVAMIEKKGSWYNLYRNDNDVLGLINDRYVIAEWID